MTPRLAVAALGALGILWAASGSAGTDPECARPVARPVAIVTEVDGDVRIVAQGRTVHPDVADSVEQDATVVLKRGARIVLVYPKVGSIYEMQGPGRFVAHADAVESRGGPGLLAKRDMASVLRALRIRPEGTTLQGSAAMRGASALELQADGPTGSQLTRDSIRLCWRPLGPQWLYRVRLIDDDGIVLFEAQTRDSIFEVPSTFQLQASAPYLWHVLATGPNGKSAEAAGQFRRLAVDSELALLRAESMMPELDPTGRALLRIARRQQGFVPGGASVCLHESGDQPLKPASSTGSE